MSIVSKYIRTDYGKTLPFLPTDQCIDLLIQKGFLVVMDENKFWGIVTPGDLLAKHHNLIADSIVEKPKINPEDPIDKVIKKMEEKSNYVLPVFEKDNFLGVISYRDILKSYSYSNQNLSLLSERNWEQFQNTIIASIAHDFNNILQAVYGNVELLALEPKFDEVDIQTFSLLKDKLNQAIILNRQFLHFSQEGCPTHDLHDTKKQITENVLFYARSSSIDVNFELSDSLHELAMSGQDFSRIIGNLIINAIQAMSKKGTITVKADNYKNLTEKSKSNFRDSSYVWLEITDNGCEIPEENILNIFNYGFTTKKAGTGQGLPIVNSIVINNGGTIECKSSPEIGTTFTLLLPALPDES